MAVDKEAFRVLISTAMPNIHAAEKRVRSDKKRRLHNIEIKSELKTLTKQFLASLKPGNGTQAAELYRNLVKRIDQAAGKDILHKNTASRKKSRYALRLAKVQS